jgi:cation:H+ antiporter
MLTYILFAIGFVMLIKGASMLVDGASSVAKKANISPIVIGLTIVAFGTSAPELIVNIYATLEDNTDIAIGNVIGSNIGNVFLILGIAAIINPLVSKENTVWKEIPLSLLAALLIGLMANDVLFDGATSSVISRIDGFVFIAFFIIFLYYTFGIAKVEGEASADEVKEMPVGKSVLFITIGLVGLSVGGKFIVDGAVQIAKTFHISESLIGLTIVAIGTSLPELATSAMAAYKKQSDIAIGNVVGSNIFNTFWILGMSAVISPLPFSPNQQLDTLVNILASVVLFVLLMVGKRHVIQKWQGILMIIIYVIYVGYLISVG